MVSQSHSIIASQGGLTLILRTLCDHHLDTTENSRNGPTLGVYFVEETTAAAATTTERPRMECVAGLDGCGVFRSVCARRRNTFWRLNTSQPGPLWFYANRCWLREWSVSLRWSIIIIISSAS